MVSLINHEYSRREAHGRFVWQSMPSNGQRSAGAPCNVGSNRSLRWARSAGLDVRPALKETEFSDFLLYFGVIKLLG